jgi:hypothetical protein
MRGFVSGRSHTMSDHEDSSNYVDAWEDPPEADVEGDNEENCVLNRLRFTNRVVAKLQSHGLTPNDASFVYEQAKASNNFEFSTSRSGKLTAFGRIGKRKLRIILGEIINPETRKRADYDVVTFLG